MSRIPRAPIGLASFETATVPALYADDEKSACRTFEIVQRMANQESARTTGLYDRRPDLIVLDEIERIRI